MKLRLLLELQEQYSTRDCEDKDLELLIHCGESFRFLPPFVCLVSAFHFSFPFQSCTHCRASWDSETLQQCCTFFTCRLKQTLFWNYSWMWCLLFQIGLWVLVNECFVKFLLDFLGELCHQSCALACMSLLLVKARLICFSLLRRSI